VDLWSQVGRRIPRDSALMRLYEPLWRRVRLGGVGPRPTLRYIRHHGLTIKAGPFEGLRYPRSAVLDVPGLVPRLAATYELELHGTIENLVDRDPKMVVNIGAGDGYYAAGMALRCGGASVVAFEADPYYARTCARIARFNGFEDRVDVRGVCTAAGLAELDVPDRTVVICDCEGHERELIDPPRVSWLGKATLLVECHDFGVQGTHEELRARLEATHSSQLIAPARRYVADHELLWVLKPVHQETVILELRPLATPWLVAIPKA
jgi:hypothetical protein